MKFLVADILIRGMEMPTQDALLHIHADGRAVFYPFCVLDEVTECEAIELPPHGDLISKDDTMNAILGEPTDAHYPSWYASIVNEMPAIIPANKEETDDKE